MQYRIEVIIEVPDEDVANIIADEISEHLYNGGYPVISKTVEEY